MENDSITTSQSFSDISSVYSRPIMVGYAFGPKKMSTMKKVMAEVSMSMSDITPETLIGIEDSQGETMINHSSVEQRLTISFVPLILDSSLHLQHGGKFDVILHKMTEDILCMSSLALSFKGKCSNQEMCIESLEESEKNAHGRIQQLIDYKEKFPSCNLIDHPKDVEKLMCRSDTSRILSECLINVTTKRGIPVRTPNFMVVNESLFGDSNSDLAELVANKIHDASFTYPVIAKPLAAAGTVQSHKMVIIRRHDGLEEVTAPYLLQEYVNHNEQLFKVYVLGDNIWVFGRHSLPDLPIGEESDNTNHDDSFLKFDSQKKYPSISDFHIKNDDAIHHSNMDRISCNGTTVNHEKHNDSFVPEELKANEIKPVADALRKAFSIDLFGFDLLMSSEMSQDGEKSRPKELLVVDVNYFPSFKEVSNFPILLGKYLLQRGLEARKKSCNALS